MLFDLDGHLYISVHGAFSPANRGAVVRFDGMASQKRGEAPLQFR
jgi:hypothetical protein